MEDELIIEIDYDPQLFGDDVEKIGYTDEQIDSFTTKCFPQQEKLEFEQPQCTVCLESFSVTNVEAVCKLGCNHIFHDACIRPWLKKNENCPLCLTKVSECVKKQEPKKRKRQVSALHEPRERSRRLRGLPPLE